MIHSQIREAETVIDNLSELLEMSSSEVRKRVEKISSIERIKSNVDKKREIRSEIWGWQE